MKKWLLGMIASLWFGYGCAEEIDLQALLRETQISRQASPGMDLVWWVPSEYWRESMRKSALSPKQQEEMVSTVDDYVVVAVLEASIGTLGVMSSSTKEELEKKTVCIVGDETLHPIPEADLTPGARNFFQIMRPLLSNMMGSMGQGLHFLAFKGKNAKHQRLVDPKEAGRLLFKVGEKDFAFRLPLGSLLPPKFDTESGERFPGNYEFSPFTGKKLTDTK